MNITLYPEMLTPEILESLLKISMKVDIDLGTHIIRLEVVNRYTVGDFTISIGNKEKNDFILIPGIDENHGITPGVIKDYIWTVNFINIYNINKVNL